MFNFDCYKGEKRVVKQNHVELQDYLLESSKTANNPLASQSADQNASKKQTELQETISTAFQELPSISGITIKVKQVELLYFIDKPKAKSQYKVPAQNP